MDIFNRKKIEELEAEVKRLRGVEAERDGLGKALRDTERAMEKLVTLRDSIPNDCTPGTYCRACEFVKPYNYYNYIIPTNRHSTVTGYICNKANVCKNFKQKEIEKDD